VSLVAAVPLDATSIIGLFAIVCHCSGAGKAVARKLTVEVQAGSEETDEELADRAH
jgi:hypothetical protein